MNLRPLWIVSAVVVMAGCGSGPPATKAASSTGAGGSASTQISDAQLNAQKLTLATADVPSGWTETATPQPDARLVTLNKERNTCLGLAADHGSGDIKAYGDTFILGTSKILSQVDVSNDETDVQGRAGLLPSTTQLNCLAKVANSALQQSLTTSAHPNATVSTRASTFAIPNTGDGAAGVRYTSTLTGASQTEIAYTDNITLSSGPDQITITVVTAAAPPDIELELTLVKKVIVHLGDQGL